MVILFIAQTIEITNFIFTKKTALFKNNNYNFCNTCTQVVHLF